MLGTHHPCTLGGAFQVEHSTAVARAQAGASEGRGEDGHDHGQELDGPGGRPACR